MGLIEIPGDSAGEELTFSQRWGHYLSLIFIVAALLFGLNIRSSVIFATQEYNNLEAGIRANYPSGWLIDDEGSYVFRVRDMSRQGFKTTIQVAVRPFTPAMSPRNIFDELSLERAQIPSYQILSLREVTSSERSALPADSATVMEYTFVPTDNNAFTESVAAVVIGQDILVEARGQAILITFLADARTFDDDVAVFNRFLSTLDF